VQIERKSGRLKDLGITIKCYIFVSGYDKNSTHSEDVTAFGLQYATMLTKEDNSKDIEEKEASILLEDGEVVSIDGVEYVTHLAGDYSDAIWFKEVGCKELVEINTVENVLEGKITRGKYEGYIGRFCENSTNGTTFVVFNTDGKTVETKDADRRVESEYFDDKQISKIRLSQYKGNR
jgi:hypothetical protein